MTPSRDGNRHRMPFQVLVAGALLAVALTQGCAPNPDPPSNTAESPPSTSLDTPPSPIGGSGPGDPIATPPPSGETPSSIDHDAQPERSVILEIGRECGFCGDDWWHYELPLFRLYDDGLAIFRTGGPDPRVVPYRSARLADPQRDELVGFALEDGGLRSAQANYPGTGDDAGSTTFRIDESSGGETTTKTVRLSDTFGDQVDDQEMRDRLQRLADTLFNIEPWLRDRDIEIEAFVPSAYTAAMLWKAEGETIEPWPWADLPPSDFAETWPFGPRLARLTPDQASAAGVGPGGDRIGTLWSSPGMVADVYVRPVLPGDDVPGSFGLRPDTVAVTVTDGIRVRSLPEVSEASAKLDPLLRDGDALFVFDGPVDGSGYRWYWVHAPRTGLTGWVAWADKTGSPWIEPYPLRCSTTGSDDPIAAEIGLELMQRACSRDAALAAPRG